MWTNQKQQENALEIARQAGALYDKFEGFVSDLVKIGKKMDEAKTEYQGAMNKLVDGKGNLITSVEKLKKMGITCILKAEKMNKNFKTRIARIDVDVAFPFQL
jgi:DNA anti-recombination protein RmuC